MLLDSNFVKLVRCHCNFLNFLVLGIKMRKFCLVLALVLGVAAPVHAAKFGVSLGLGAGDSSAEFDSPSGSSRSDSDVQWTEFGFALATGAGGGARTFTYRLDASGVRGEFNPDNGGDVDVTGVNITNTFGFYVAQGPVGVWLGPALNVGLGRFQDGGADGTYLAVGLAPTLGIDFNGSAMFSLSLSYRIQTATFEYDEMSLDGDLDTDELFLRAGLLWGD